MRRIVLAATLVLVPFAHGLADEVADRIREGVRLHDAQDYQGAMRIYRGILKEHPHHPTAVYELAFSMRAAGVDKAEVLAFLENELDSGTRQHDSLYVLLGSAYDDAGEFDKGEAAFRRGLEGAPDSAMLHYNLGVNLGFQKRWADAAGAYLGALAKRPLHPSSWFNLAHALEEQRRAPRAFVAYARAVALEPDTERGRDAAKRLWPLLFDSVKKDDVTDPTQPAGNVTITIEALVPEGTAEGAPPDPQAMEAIMTSIVAANRYVEEWEKKSDAEFFAHALETVTAIASETSGDDPFWNVARPYFDEARSKKHLEAMAYVLRNAAGDPDAARWLERHRKRVNAYAEWARSLNE